MNWVNPLEINGHLQKIVRTEGYRGQLPWIRVTPGFVREQRNYQIDLDAMIERLTKATTEELK